MKFDINRPITAFLLLHEGKTIDCDSATLEMFLCGRDDLLELDFFKIFSFPLQPNGQSSSKLIKTHLKQALIDEPQYFFWRFRRLDNTHFDAEVSLKKKNFQGEEYLQVIIIDISEKRRTNEALLVQRSYFQQLFENSPEAIIIANGQTQILNVNRSFEQIFQYSYQEAIGQRIVDLIVPNTKKDEYWNSDQLVRQGKMPRGETVRMRKDGSLVQVGYVSFPIEYDEKPVGYYVIYTDITARKEAEEKLRYISYHDSLTGLYNRSFFELKMQEYETNPPEYLGMIVCDIDGLKIINDTLGHKAGDKFLLKTSELLSIHLKETDILARIGGDEFVILLPGYKKQEVNDLVDKIRQTIKDHNNNIAVGQMLLNVSMGSSAMEDHRGQSIHQLFIESDNYMYRDKIHRGKSARSAIVQTLMTALEARDFITEGHAERMQRLVTEIAKALNLTEKTINELRLLAQFHDIGKVGIPDNILFKPGPLTPEERKIIERHSEIGARIAQAAPDLAPISDWILKHHEWWDGSGYPFGLKGTEIPMECRVLAIADAYDSMTSDRPYRKALSHEAAISEIIKFSEIQFDPAIVTKCLPILKRLHAEEEDETGSLPDALIH